MYICDNCHAEFDTPRVEHEESAEYGPSTAFYCPAVALRWAIPVSTWPMSARYATVSKIVMTGCATSAASAFVAC
jgi:hypothetical protein